jgi:CopG family nickel-responsive transcriptional regulator
MDDELLNKLDRMVKESRYPNRSEFIRDMLRHRLVEEEWESDREVVGTLTLTFDHHQRELTDRLTELQHDHCTSVLASTHVHLNEDMCVEVVIMRGRADMLRELADEMRGQRGVLHGELAISSVGRELA